MAIQRWEMLLSAQTDCYLLKIQGDRQDVDRILLSHPKTCQTVQEIAGDIFRWVIFVVDAPLSERLAIQNQVMSLTTDTSGTTPSEELLDVLDGLSGALQDLTNLTEDEQAFVMNKMAHMGTPAAPPATPQANPLKNVPHSPSLPGAYPPAGTPLPRVTFPGQPGLPTGPKSPSGPGQIPMPPKNPGGGSPLPSPGPIPSIIRPVQPPRSFPGAPNMPGPLPSIPIPKMTPPPTPIPPKSAPMGMPPPPSSPMPIPQLEPVPQKKAPPPQIAPPPLPKKEEVSSERPPLKIEPTVAPLEKEGPPKVAVSPVEELKPEPIKTKEPEPIIVPLATPFSPPPQDLAPPAPPVTDPSPKAEDGSIIRISVFYPTGQEQAKDQFMNTLIDVAQKKSKRPTSFQMALSVPTVIVVENSTEWIWKAKTIGSDIFFVILPEELGSESMDPLVGEALSAGLRCFLVPQAEIASKLLYMDLMVELMMFKRRVRVTPV